MKKLVGDEALAHAAALGAQLYVERPGGRVRAVSMPEAVEHAKDAPGEVTCEEAPREPAVLRARAVSHCRGLATNLVHLHKLVDDLTGAPGLDAGRALLRACLCFPMRSDAAARRLGQCASEACRTAHTLPEALPDPLSLSRGMGALLSELWRLQRSLVAHPLDPHLAAEVLAATLARHAALQSEALLALCEPCRRRLSPRIGGDPFYLCGRCGRPSYNPVDAQEHYCPSCRIYEDDDGCE